MSRSVRRASYRKHFLSHAEARHYDSVVYGTGSADDMLWGVEANFLERAVGKLRESHPRIDYLDFACGTGRILAFLEDLVDSATGIDISAPMLEIAATKVKKAKLVCRDITTGEADFEGRYDLITAFRFLLNAEPALRIAGLRAMAARLKGPDSLLVVNTHGNPLSYKLPLVPYHLAMRALRADKSVTNYLTTRRAIALIEQAGLQVDAVIGMGFVTEKLYGIIPSAAIWRIESMLAGAPLLQRLAVNQMYFCRRLA